MQTHAVELLKARLKASALATAIALPATKVGPLLELATDTYPADAKEMARVEIDSLFEARHDFDASLLDDEVLLLLHMALQARLLVAAFLQSPQSGYRS